MIRMRERAWRRCGASLAGLALGLQLVLSSFALLPAAPPDPVEAFGPHALCLAADADTRRAPQQRDSTPPTNPAHVHDASCCLWHHVAGTDPVSPTLALPVAYGLAAAGETEPTAFVPGPDQGPRNARAPPTLA